MNLKGKPLEIYLVDAGHPKDRAWVVHSESIDSKQLTGTLYAVPKKQMRTVREVEGGVTEQLSKHRVILTLQTAYAQTLPDTLHASIPLDKVVKLEVFEYDKVRSDTNTGLTIVLSIIGGVIAILVLVLVIALATKESCPFIYADNPDGRVFEGEIYSGATYPQLERHDWLPMPDLRAHEGEYRIVMANKVREVQHTNLLELAAIDHPEGSIVLFDKYGRLHTLAHLQEPRTAITLRGEDIRTQLLREDSLHFLGTPDNHTSQAEETILLEFQRPHNARFAKLVINAKNSLWLDYAHGLMVDEFGEYAGKIRQQFLKKSTADLQAWMLRQNIPLSVWLETAPGDWERIDYFNLAGPMAIKRDVLPLDLSRVKGDPLRIKLSSGFLFWEIDYVGLDFSAAQRVVEHHLAPVAAIVQNGRDMLAALSADDTLYYHQPNIGDEASVRFPAPPLTPGLQRSLILHAKGHYQILREPTPGRPSIRYLKQFQQPNAFPKFARSRWQAIARENKLVFETDRPAEPD